MSVRRIPISLWVYRLKARVFPDPGVCSVSASISGTCCLGRVLRLVRALGCSEESLCSVSGPHGSDRVEACIPLGLSRLSGF